MRTKSLIVLIHIRLKSEAGTVKHVLASSDFFTDHYKVVILLWILFVIYVSFSSLLYCLCLTAFWLFAGKRLTSWHSCVRCFFVFLSLSHIVSLVRCGT